MFYCDSFLTWRRLGLYYLKGPFWMRGWGLPAAKQGQIEHHKGEGQGRVASLQQMDGVEEHEVPWDNQEEQDPG